MRSEFQSPRGSAFSPHDDASVAPLSKAQARQLHSLHAQFAGELAELLRQTLGAQGVSLVALEETTIAAYAARDARPDYVLPFATARPQAGRLELFGGLAQAMLDAVLNFRGLTPEPHAMSEIEEQLLSKQLELLLSRYAACWPCGPIRADASPVAPALHEPIFVATFNVTLPEATGHLAIVLRLAAWRELLDREPVETAAGQPNIGMLGAIGDTTLQARALLGSTRICVEDFISLRVGDVICLDQDADAPVEVRVGNRTKLYGAARIQNGKYVVTIEQIAARGGC